MVIAYTLILSLLMACAIPQQDGARPSEVGVRGVVRIRGEAPAMKDFEVEAEMAAVCGHKTHTKNAWLTGKDGGLRNCVVTLHPKSGAAPDIKPMPPQSFTKFPCGFSPHVLVVQKGTKVIFKNESPLCLGFRCRTKINREVDVSLPKGQQHEAIFNQVEMFGVACPIREYMVGFIAVIDTPYYAITGPDGAFQITGVPPGKYDIRVWHEAGGILKDAGPGEVAVGTEASSILEYQFRPAGD